MKCDILIPFLELKRLKVLQRLFQHDGACVSRPSVTYRLTVFHQGLEVSRLTKTADMAPRSCRKWQARSNVSFCKQTVSRCQFYRMSLLVLKFRQNRKKFQGLSDKKMDVLDEVVKPQFLEPAGERTELVRIRHQLKNTMFDWGIWGKCVLFRNIGNSSLRNWGFDLRHIWYLFSIEQWKYQPLIRRGGDKRYQLRKQFECKEVKEYTLFL